MAHPPSGLSWGALLLAGASALGTFYIEYTHNDREIAQKVSALEAHRQDDRADLDHIKTQVDRLVEWALGKQQ